MIFDDSPKPASLVAALAAMVHQRPKRPEVRLLITEKNDASENCRILKDVNSSLWNRCGSILAEKTTR